MNQGHILLPANAESEYVSQSLSLKYGLHFRFNLSGKTKTPEFSRMTCRRQAFTTSSQSRTSVSPFPR